MQRVKLGQQSSKSGSLAKRQSFCTNKSKRTSYTAPNFENVHLSAVQNDSFDSRGNTNFTNELGDDIQEAPIRARVRKSNSCSYTRHFRDSFNETKSPDPRLVDSKRCLQILGEIYSIAAVQPHVLDTCFEQIRRIYQNPSNNVKVILERLNELRSSS